MQKIVVAVTGASGSVYAKVLLDKLLYLKDHFSDIALVMSTNAKDVWQHELGNQSYADYPFTLYATNNYLAPFASGSSSYHTMLVVPCSMGTLGRIASGISDTLITRTADVMLKERKKLILMVRETPYNLIHIRNMETVTLAGGIIAPATPSFYSRPSTIEEVAATVTDRLLDLAGIQHKTYRWGKE